MFDAIALDYRTVTVIVDATAAAAPEIHSGEQVYDFYAVILILLSCLLMISNGSFIYIGDFIAFASN